MNDSFLSEPAFMLPVEGCLKLHTTHDHLSLFATLFAGTNSNDDTLLRLNRLHLAACFEHYAAEVEAVLEMMTKGARMSREMH
ncbi:MAG TPA: hypothetical protein VL997_15870 [Dyella sp.]|nr:hypothetical protein [Dyella sp.]